jgi:hypothetical protein
VTTWDIEMGRDVLEICMANPVTYFCSTFSNGEIWWK